jgi:ABC-2 type transport system ATP-binding protein
MSAIRTENLSRKFGRLAAVSDLTLDVGAGELFGLVGPDGAGKSTVIKLLASVLKPSAGQLWVLGHDTVRDGRAVKHRIAYMAQRGGLYADLTAEENLSFYGELYGVAPQKRSERIDSLLELSRLRPFRRRLAGRLSGGMQQKLALSCALIHEPELLLLDEPTCGVDPVSRRELWRILSRYVSRGVTVLVSTAYLDEAERCNRVGLLDKGRLLACGRPAELKSRLGRSVLLIETASPRVAWQALRGPAQRMYPTMLGNRVRLVAADAQSAEVLVRRTLSAADIDIQRINLEAPSLEDVFVVTAQVEQQGQVR